MLKDPNHEGLLAITMKVLHAHLNLFKLFTYFLIALAFSLTFGITLSLFSDSFLSLHHLQTSEKLSTTPPPSNEDLGIKNYIRNRNLKREIAMRDEELMWRASMATKSRKNGVPKVAFLFLVKGSLPLAPLWEEFFKGDRKSVV